MSLSAAAAVRMCDKIKAGKLIKWYEHPILFISWPNITQISLLRDLP